MRGAPPPSPERVRLFQEIGRRLDARGFIASNDGNLSLREADGTFLLTCTGSRKGHLKPDEIVRVASDGRLLYGEKEASSEVRMHLALFALRPDVRAIVHAHPPVATGFSVARLPMDACVLPEVILTLGSVPLAPYGSPGTEELGETLAPAARDHDAILLANHGAVTLGPDLEEAYFRMERLEHTSRILLVAHLLGRVQSLSRPEVERLFPRQGGEGRGSLPCIPSPGGAEEVKADRPNDADALAEADRERLVAIILEVLESKGLRAGP